MCPSSTSPSEPAAPLDAQVLVAIDPGDPACGAGPGIRRLVLAVFTVALVGTALVDRLAPLDKPRLLGAEAAAEQRLRAQARFVDGSLAHVFERQLRLGSRVRSWVTPPYGAALYRFLGLTKPGSVVGPDGWIFRSDRIVPDPTPLEPRLRAIEERVGGLHDRLAALGVRLVVALVPRRSEIQRDFLPRGLDPGDGHEQVVARLRARGVEVVDLLPAFRDHRGPALFHRRDTHWNELGMALAAEQVARETGLLVAPERRLHRLADVGPQPEQRDLLPMIGIMDPAEFKRVAWLLPGFETRAIRLLDEDGNALGPLPAPAWPPRIALVGTSFSAGNRFTDYLSHFTGSVVANEARRGLGPSLPVVRLAEKIRDHGAPQVVIWEVPAHTLLNVRRPLVRVPEAIAALPQPALGAPE